jgi:predicted acyl esterase
MAGLVDYQLVIGPWNHAVGHVYLITRASWPTLAPACAQGFQHCRFFPSGSFSFTKFAAPSEVGQFMEHKLAAALRSPESQRTLPVRLFVMQREAWQAAESPPLPSGEHSRVLWLEAATGTLVDDIEGGVNSMKELNVDIRVKGPRGVSRYTAMTQVFMPVSWPDCTGLEFLRSRLTMAGIADEV